MINYILDKIMNLMFIIAFICFILSSLSLIFRDKDLLISIIVFIISIFTLYLCRQFFRSRIQFGKHKGTKWEDLPKSYLLWIINNHSDFNYRERAKEIIEQSKDSIVVKDTDIINFGKYKGQEWDNLPMDYLKWLSKNHSDINIKNKAHKIFEKYKKSEEFFNQIFNSKPDHIISPEGIYTNGVFYSNEQLKEKKEYEEYMKEQDEVMQLEAEQEDLEWQQELEQQERKLYK